MTELQSLPKLGVSACVWRGGEVLLIRRAKPPLTGAWSLPGGHVEPGEAVSEAARRELFEETGVAAELDHLVGLYDLIRRDAAGAISLHYVIACYTGWWTGGEARAASDAAAVRWLAPAQFGATAFVPSVREAIGRAQFMLTPSLKGEQ